MGSDLFEVSINLIKLLVIFLAMVQVVPILVWVERRGSAFIQNRFGPNRVGPLGLTQLLADAVKFIMKEEFVPKKGVAFLYYAAPAIAMVPAALAFGAIPLSVPIQVGEFVLGGQTWGPYVFNMQSFQIGVGIVFVFGVSALGAYSLLMAGYGSSNKYSLMGALRASAQMISYELSLGISLVGALLVFGSFDFNEIVQAQTGAMNFTFMGSKYVLPVLPNWGILYQPLGAVLFFAATFAECNRLPFDLPEAEAELVAGFHTEYGGFKMLLFFMGEYGHMLVASALLIVFYFGGYHIWIPFLPIEWFTPEAIKSFFLANFSDTMASIFTSLVFLLSFIVKLVFFLWFFVWVRWTLPRFKYDRLMDLGWKTMLPWSMANVIITATIIFLAHMNG